MFDLAVSKAANYIEQIPAALDRRTDGKDIIASVASELAKTAEHTPGVSMQTRAGIEGFGSTLSSSTEPVGVVTAAPTRKVNNVTRIKPRGPSGPAPV